MYLFRQIYLYFEENYFSASLNGNYDNLNFVKTATTLLMVVGGLCLGILIASFVIVFQKKVVGRFIRGLLSADAKDEKSARSLSDLSLAKSGVIRRELSRASVSRKLVSIVTEEGRVLSYESELREAFPSFAAEVAYENAEGADEKAEAEATRAEGAENTAALPVEEDWTPEIPEKDRAAREREVGGEEKREGTARRALKRTKSFLFEKRFRLSPIDFATARFFIPEENRYRAELRFREKGSSVLSLVLATLLILAVFLLSLRFIPVLVNMLDATVGNFKGR